MALRLEQHTMVGVEHEMAEYVGKDRIRAKIVIPLVVLLLISGAIMISGVYIIEERHFSDEIHSRAAEVNNLFSGLLFKESKFMRAQLQFIEADPALLEAWQKQDRNLLYDKARPLFEEMFTGFNVTHFYFIEPDGTCFLRVHTPERFGDRIKRFTFEKAAAESQTSYGIELGPLGTFTLRVVSPWFHNGKLLGYLELGEEIEHLTPKIKEIAGLDIVFTIDKSFLDEDLWKEGNGKSLVPKGDWDRFENFVIIDKTLPSLPPAIVAFLAENHFRTIVKNIEVGDLLMGLCIHPLRDVSGSQVGSIMVITDLTRASYETRKAVLIITSIVLAVALLFIVFYIIYSGRIEKQVHDYQHHLEDLVKERTKELQTALDEVKVLSGFLPICASCKQIRDDKGYWTQIESYIREHSDAEFSHGICPDCAKKLYPEFNSRKDEE